LKLIKGVEKMTMDNVAKHRRDESTGHVPIRSDRLFCQSDYWYFKTREGMDIGPYDNMELAKKGIQDFTDFLNTAEPDMVNRISQYARRAA
jgi:hypothetical protein